MHEATLNLNTLAKNTIEVLEVPLSKVNFSVKGMSR